MIDMIKTEEGLEFTTPEQEGVDSRLIMNFLCEAAKSGQELHGIVMLRHGRVIFEAYNAPYRADIPHIMHSFTKCLTNTAVGLAFSRGLLKLDDPILKYLPEYAEGAGEYLRRCTIRNMITMRNGQERSIGGNEWRPLKTSWEKAYFQVPFVSEPGETYMYSSGNSYILSDIVQRLTGKTARQYVYENVTSKMGIRDFDWMLSPEGICSGGNGISLTPREMAKIGQLYLNHGNWKGEQLLSEEWVDYAMGYKDPIPPVNGVQYNFHWNHQGDIWAAQGMFGQTCAQIPALDMVVAFTAADQAYVFSDILQKEFINPMKAGVKLDERSWPILKDMGERMTLKNQYRCAAKHVQPEKDSYDFELDGSIDGITRIELKFKNGSMSYAMTDGRGRHEVVAGMEQWIDGETTMTGAYLHHQYEVAVAKISACAWWEDEKTLVMAWRFPEMAFFDHLSLTWEEGRIRVNRWVNMNSQALCRPELSISL